MRFILFITTLFLFFSCNKTNQASFTLDPSKPVEIGIESIINTDKENVKINIYMINHNPVAGVQFEITPNSFFEVDTVLGGRCEENNFSLNSNKQGKILGFSMTGMNIPESNSANKTENILFSVLAKSIRTIDTLLTINPIIASSDAKKMDFISIPFEVIGK